MPSLTPVDLPKQLPVSLMSSWDIWRGLCLIPVRGAGVALRCTHGRGCRKAWGFRGCRFHPWKWKEEKKKMEPSQPLIKIEVSGVPAVVTQINDLIVSLQQLRLQPRHAWVWSLAPEIPYAMVWKKKKKRNRKEKKKSFQCWCHSACFRIKVNDSIWKNAFFGAGW